MTTPLFLLRCVQLGISIRDLDLLTIGMVNDMYAESSNDEWNYNTVATQADFDVFKKNLQMILDRVAQSHYNLNYRVAQCHFE